MENRKQGAEGKSKQGAEGKSKHYQRSSSLSATTIVTAAFTLFVAGVLVLEVVRDIINTLSNDATASATQTASPRPEVAQPVGHFALSDGVSRDEALLIVLTAISKEGPLVDQLPDDRADPGFVTDYVWRVSELPKGEWLVEGKLKFDGFSSPIHYRWKVRGGGRVEAVNEHAMSVSQEHM